MIEKRGHFEVIGREIKYKNRWIEVVEDQVVCDGKPGIFGVIKTNNASSVLPIDDEGNVYLNFEYKYGANKEIYTNPGGFIEPGEDPLVAAKRELKEESGFTAREWISLGEVLSYASISDSKYHIYIAKGLELGETNFDEHERIKTIKMPLKLAYQKVLNGEINYSPTVILILRAYDLFGK